MTLILQKPFLVAGLFLFLAVSVAIGAWHAHTQVDDVIHKAELQITKQESVLYELAERTDRNEGDVVVNAIIKDCSVREEFEELLNNIGELSRTELRTLESYYEGCASFYAERKAIMIARLEREVEVLEQYTAFFETVAPERLSKFNLEAWQNLVALEKERSTGLNDQVRIQREVIEILLAGGVGVGESITALLQEAQSVGERLEVSGAQIDTLRESLSKL